MRLIFLVIAISASLLSAPLPAADRAFHFTCDFMEKLGDQQWQVVDSRKYSTPLDSYFHFSMGNFSYRLTAKQLQDTVVQLESQVNCFDNPNHNFFEQNVVFKGAAVFFDSALVRGNSIYRVRVVYDSLGRYKPSCSYAFSDSSYKSDPSGDFDFYFVKNTLGDYHWNAIRDVFEKDYDGFVERFRPTDRTKINFYIAPCQPPDVGWDQRWNNGYDYARHNVFARYDHGTNALQPQVVYMLRLMRIYGYAPALIMEGAANSFEYCEIWTKDAYKNGKLPDLTKLGASGKFRALDRELSSYAAGSFLNYVYNMGGTSKLMQWYQQATDLTVNESFEKVYQKPIDNYVDGWHQYLDTVTFSAGTLRYYAARAQSFLKYPEILVYAEKAAELGLAPTWAAQTRSGLYYTFGDYKKAADILQPLMEDTSTVKQTTVFRANMLFAAGKVDSAEALYQMATGADTSLHLVYYKLGQIEQMRGNVKKAIELFRKANATVVNPASMVDYDLALGDAYLASGQADSAGVYFQRAMDNSKLLVGEFSDNALHHLRYGRAALRLNSLDIAAQELDLAFFLEERMFFIGQIYLAKGELADAKKKRKEAIANYKQVLELPSAHIDRKAAQKYLDRPYQNYYQP